jgi:hypothetical protein
MTAITLTARPFALPTSCAIVASRAYPLQHMEENMKLSVEKVWRDFEKLMDAKGKVKEEVYHRYMVKFPALIPTLYPLENTIFSKLSLGGHVITDFAFVREDSGGLRWHFIEIERPAYRLFNNRGDPTAEFNHGMTQLRNFRIWFRENLDYVRKYLPFADRMRRFGVTGEPNLKLVIGRRSRLLESNKPLLLEYKKEFDILSFDRLKDNLTFPPLLESGEIKCCSFVGGRFQLLSNMKVSISYYIDDDLAS